MANAVSRQEHDDLKAEILRLRERVHVIGNTVQKADSRLTLLERSRQQVAGVIVQVAIGLLFLWLNWITRAK